MVAEVITGLGLFKSMLDAAKGLKDISDATIRNAAVIELQEKILSAQEHQAALVESVRSLKEEVAGLKAWDAEKERYKLTDYGGGTFAYELKEAEVNGEPPHRICANCYQNSHKSILQHKRNLHNQQTEHSCPACGSEFKFGVAVSVPLRAKW